MLDHQPSVFETPELKIPEEERAESLTYDQENREDSGAFSSADPERQNLASQQVESVYGPALAATASEAGHLLREAMRVNAEASIKEYAALVEAKIATLRVDMLDRAVEGSLDYEAASEALSQIEADLTAVRALVEGAAVQQTAEQREIDRSKEAQEKWSLENIQRALNPDGTAETADDEAVPDTYSVSTLATAPQTPQGSTPMDTAVLSGSESNSIDENRASKPRKVGFFEKRRQEKQHSLAVQLGSAGDSLGYETTAVKGAAEGKEEALATYERVLDNLRGNSTMNRAELQRTKKYVEAQQLKVAQEKNKYGEALTKDETKLLKKYR